jgi:hypothetical protein
VLACRASSIKALSSGSSRRRHQAASGVAGPSETAAVDQRDGTSSAGACAGRGDRLLQADKQTAHKQTADKRRDDLWRPPASPATDRGSNSAVMPAEPVRRGGSSTRTRDPTAAW